jgi:aryl-alcohol dehydrogenase-like predicted oxidoreductase
MLFGELNSKEEAGTLLDACLEGGINFFDTAEMYPVPQRAETHGRSETYLGEWVKKQQR